MTNPSLLGPKRDKVSRGDIEVHDHVCGIYDTRDAQFEPACTFLKVGLARNEQCLYIAEQLEPRDFLSKLERNGVDVVAASANGSLIVVTGEDVRLKLGGFTPEAMLSFLSELEQSALEAGFTAFRLCADMTWLRKDNIEASEFFRYEAMLNQLLLDRHIVGLCQFSMEDFRSELLIAAAETHPLLVYNATVCDNFYYVPPEEYLKPRFADTKLKRMLFNIISRERMFSRALME